MRAEGFLSPSCADNVHRRAGESTSGAVAAPAVLHMPMGKRKISSLCLVAIVGRRHSFIGIHNALVAAFWSIVDYLSNHLETGTTFTSILK